MARAGAGDAGSVSGAASLFGPSSTSSPMMNIDCDLRKSLAEINSMLATNVASWLKKRGKSLRPKLSEEQRKQLEECFELMDADGSGAIDADELGAAFKLLGLEVSRAEIAEMLAEVDEDGSGECEYPEFVEIMTTTLAKLAHKREEQAGGNQVPFALLATAYRRKRIMEGLFTGDREVMAQVTQIAETASRRAADEAQRQQQVQHQQQQQAARQRHTGSTSSQPSPTGRHSSIFRSAAGSNNGSTDGSVQSSGNGQFSDPGITAAAVVAAGEARAAQLAAQAGVPTGLLRALQHVKSFCSSTAGSPLASPSCSHPGSKATSMVHSGGPLLMPVPVLQPAPTGATALHRAQAAAAAAAAVARTAAAVDGGGAAAAHSVSFLEDDGLEDLPVEAISDGVLDIDEQRQLISLLRAKTRKRLEILAAAAAAAGQPGASATGARFPTLPGGCSSSSSTAWVRSTGAGGPAASDVAAGGVSDAGVGGGGGAGEGSGRSMDTAGLQSLVGAKQQITSTLMLKQLTQDFEPPKFALPTRTPSQRSISGCCSSSASPTPAPGCALRSCRSACGSPLPSRQPAAALLAAEYTSSSLQRSAAAAAAAAGQDDHVAVTTDGGTGLRRGVDFGDTQIYEYEPTRGRSGPSNNNSRRSSRAGGSRRSSARSSDGGGGSSSSSGGGALTNMHRSKSLGSLLVNNAGHLSTPSSSVRGQGAGSGAGGVSSPGSGQLRAPMGRAASRSPSSKGLSNNDSSSGGVCGRSPSRHSSMSMHKRDPSAAALQQIGVMCVLPEGAGAGQQQQQQWLAVPQLPRLAGAAQSCLAHHQRSKSSSPVCVGSIASSSSAGVLRPGVSPVGTFAGSSSKRAL